MAYQHQCPTASPIYTAPTQVYNNMYYPQVVPVVHPVEIINQHHCVPVPQHYVTYTVKDEVCTTSDRKPRKKRK